ncbi:MAG: RNA methyltransferase [Firmicutes bacterium]|nr:RNA methyltransferase [Bacillota bacterium]
MYIESSQNKIIKQINSLKQKKYRDKTGLFIVEGERLISECSPVYVLAREDYAGDLSRYDRVYTVSSAVFDKISDTVSPQGILGVCSIPQNDINEFDCGENAFVVILERVADPGNLGTIIRTADAAGADAVILSEGCADPYNLKTIRSTMGSVFHLPVYRNANLRDFLKNTGIKTLAAHLKGTKSCYDTDMRGSIGIIIGNEANGLSDEISGLASELVKIPMPGRAESMNAAVAAGILIYEAVRQRMG